METPIDPERMRRAMQRQTAKYLKDIRRSHRGTKHPKGATKTPLEQRTEARRKRASSAKRSRRGNR